MSEDRIDYGNENGGFEDEVVNNIAPEPINQPESKPPSGGMTINSMNRVAKPIVDKKEPVMDAHTGVIYETEAEQILGIIDKLIKDGERDTERKVNRVESIRALRMAYATITKIK